MDDRIDELVKNPLIADDVRRYAAEREHRGPAQAQGRDEILQRLRRAQADPGLRRDLAALAGDTTDDPRPIQRRRQEERVTNILGVMRTEIWPLLPDHTPITKQEREQILGYEPESGV